MLIGQHGQKLRNIYVMLGQHDTYITPCLAFFPWMLEQHGQKLSNFYVMLGQHNKTLSRFYVMLGQV